MNLLPIARVSPHSFERAARAGADGNRDHVGGADGPAPVVEDWKSGQVKYEVLSHSDTQLVLLTAMGSSEGASSRLRDDGEQATGE